MNAEELNALLGRLARQIANVQRLVDAQRDHRDLGLAHMRALNQIWSELDDHRLEMEAAEAKPAQTLEDVAQGVLRNSGLAPEVDYSGRFDAIEKRLGEIETFAKRTRQVYVAHMDGLHKELSVFLDVHPCVPPASG